MCLSTICKPAHKFFSLFSAQSNLGFLIGASLILSACSGFGEDTTDANGYISGFSGGVAVDEPYAALYGERILAQGGTAADAIVGMAFTLAVSKPSTVSLAAGGSCVVHDPQIDLNETLQFSPKFSFDPSGKSLMPPALPRAMATLSARYGKMNWRFLLGFPEEMARSGHKLARAHSSELAMLPSDYPFSPSAKASLTSENGEWLKEGILWRQQNLAITLAILRVQGAGALYQGALARKLIDEVGQAGYSLDAQALADFLPEWQPSLNLTKGDYEWLGVRPPFIGGIMQAQILNYLNMDDTYQDLNQAQRGDLLNKLLLLAKEDALAWGDKQTASYAAQANLIGESKVATLFSKDKLNKNIDQNQLRPKFGATGLIAIDRTGLAIACDIGLFSPYGGGYIAKETGIFMAKQPTSLEQALASYSLAPSIVIHQDTKRFYYAIAGSSPLSPSTLAISADIWLAGDEIKQTMQSIDPNQIAEIGGKPVIAHCINGYPNPKIEDRLCTLAIIPSAHGLALQSTQN